MLPWGIVPLSSLPIGWGGGYLGIANQMLLVQPFCSERWETAFLNYGNDARLFSCFFSVITSHLLCPVMNSPVCFPLLFFSHDSVWIAVLLTDWALDFVSFFFLFVCFSHIYFFLYIFDRTSRAYNKISQLMILLINHPISDDFTVSCLVTHKLTGVGDRQICCY